MTVNEFVDEIHASYEKNKDTNYIFLLGAGCSKSSGIPLAGELALEWFFELKKQPPKCEKFINEHIDEAFQDEAKKLSKIEDLKGKDKLYDQIVKLYFHLFEKLFPDMIDRQKEIQRLTEDKYPGLGYYNLAQLMRKKQFNVTITTNFDDLVHDALLYSGYVKRARVISHHHLAQFIDRGDTPHIIKLHGDAHLHPFNDVDNTQKIEEPLRSSVLTLLSNTKLIVIGYGGGDESIAELLKSVSRQAMVYWCNVSTPENTALDEWWEKLGYKVFVEEFDFDKIMNAFGDKFGLESPDFKVFSNRLKAQYDESFTKESQEAIAEKDLEELNKLISQRLRSGEYSEGLKLALEAKTLIENFDDISEEVKALIDNNIGELYEKMGKYDKAMDYHEESLKIRLANLGEMHPNTATSYNNLGLVWYRKNKDDKAKKYYEKSLKIRLVTLGEKHLDTAVSYNNIGLAWGRKGEYDKAISYYKDSLHIRLSRLGESHPDTATSYSNLGVALKGKGEYDKAIEYYEKSLNIRLNTLEENHPDIAKIYNNIGSALDSKHEYNKAIEYYEKALTILHTVFPDGHPDIDVVQGNLKRAKKNLNK